MADDQDRRTWTSNRSRHVGNAQRELKAKMPSATHLWLLGELIDEAYRRELIGLEVGQVAVFDEMGFMIEEERK